MGNVGIAFDLGTSGFRGQAINLSDFTIIGTVLTARHPLPGANVMDHLSFAIEAGIERAHNIVIDAINQMIEKFNVPVEDITAIAVCGNPIQLSIFECIEIRDLAYAGERKKKLLGIVPPNRDAKVKKGSDIPGLKVHKRVKVYIPSAVKHEIGADALAMMVQSGMLERDEIALATDYGTNAEMALKVGDKIITGSCAAGPALEGQHIEYGMLAAPGAIHDVSPDKVGYRCFILDDEMVSVPGPVVDLTQSRELEKGEYEVRGITGTGVISLVYEGMSARLISIPEIQTPDKQLHLGSRVRFTEHDIIEAGKAIGAIRAGYITLAKEAGISLEDITTAYMAGASGTYVNAWKALQIGLLPPAVKKVYQIGNTSLAMAREIVCNPEKLWELQALAQKLRATHCMFGDSEVFEKAYLLELSLWGEGMPWKQYHRFAKMYQLPVLPETEKNPVIKRIYPRDIPDVGCQGITYVTQVGYPRVLNFENCTQCGLCVEKCPERALSLLNSGSLMIRTDRCNGTACKKCEMNCPEKAFKLNLM
ncbi:methylamine methyltransferase corrinoid protein reductive activase [Calderihabitans maritimus]|uniref:4Fe-4S ferredoxin n=1 Tax=Calderihabitans maritimus TaxID=1246530 RepID=A0A1Z5HNN2_9FIRM|nr:methylamine methyltransferase corrinoid protein reductive activase [Calderihabitans maritimus]GAW91058.1 4Fe-4S ferredoxin [Calderihabitans maritimus]